MNKILAVRGITELSYDTACVRVRSAWPPELIMLNAVMEIRPNAARALYALNLRAVNSAMVSRRVKGHRGQYAGHQGHWYLKQF